MWHQTYLLIIIETQHWGDYKSDAVFLLNLLVFFFILNINTSVDCLITTIFITLYYLAAGCERFMRVMLFTRVSDYFTVAALLLGTIFLVIKLDGTYTLYLHIKTYLHLIFRRGDVGLAHCLDPVLRSRWSSHYFDLYARCGTCYVRWRIGRQYRYINNIQHIMYFFFFCKY